MANEDRFGIEVIFTADATAFDKSIDDMNKTIKALRKDISAVNSVMKSTGKNFDLPLLKKKFEDYNRIVEESGRQIDYYKEKLKECYDENGRVTDKKEWLRLNAEISKSQAELLKAKDAAEKLRLMIEHIGTYKLSYEFDQMGKNLNKAAGYAQTLGNALRPLSIISGVALGGATKAAIDFESAMAGVKKTVDETPTTTYEQLEKTFRAMAQEVPSTASEIANVAEMAGQLGIEADSIENFTRVMIDLGNATDLTATDGAKAVAQFFNIMGHDASEINEIVDNFGSAVTALGNNSATTEESIVYMAKALAAASNTVGLTDQEVLGLATALSSLGLSAERGGSAMSTIMRKIETDVQTGSEAGMERLAVWGSLMDMTAQEFKELWQTDTATAINNIVKGLNQAKDVGESVYGVLGDVDISNIRQIDTITRLANGYDRFDEYMAMANDEWEKNTALSIEVNRRYQTTESQLQMLKNKLLDVGITLGQTILPIINDLIDKAKPLLDRLNQFVERNGKLVVSILGIGTALAPALLGLSKVLKVGGTLATAMSKYLKLGVQATTILGKIGAIIGISASGVGLIAGVATLAGGIGALAVAWKRAKDDAYQFEQQVNRLNDSMERSSLTADEEYRARVLQAEGALSYATQLDNLVASLDSETFSEEENANAKERIRSLVEQLNSAIGDTVYSFDEQTGQIYKNGEAVDSVTESYRNLLEEMRRAAWLETHQASFQEAVQNEMQGYELQTQAVNEYGDAISSLQEKYHLLEIPPEVRQSLMDYTQGLGGSLQEIKEALAGDEGFMTWFGGDVGQMSEYIDAFILRAEGAYDVYNQKIAESNGLIESSKIIQDQYNQVLTGTAEDFMAIAAQIANTNDLTTLSNEKLAEQKSLYEALQQAYVEKYGAENAYFTEQMRMIDEQMLANQAAHDEEVRLGEENVSKQAEFDDNIRNYKEEQAIAANDTVEADSNATADATETYAKGKADAVRDYVDAMTFAPKYLEIYARVHGLEVLDGLGGSGGFNAYRNAGFNAGGSGGYQSGNYNVTVENNFNITNGNVSASQARIFGEQIIDVLNEELGKRLRTS